MFDIWYFCMIKVFEEFDMNCFFIIKVILEDDGFVDLFLLKVSLYRIIINWFPNDVVFEVMKFGTLRKDGI